MTIRGRYYSGLGYLFTCLPDALGPMQIKNQSSWNLLKLEAFSFATSWEKPWGAYTVSSLLAINRSVTRPKDNATYHRAVPFPLLNLFALGHYEGKARTQFFATTEPNLPQRFMRLCWNDGSSPPQIPQRLKFYYVLKVAIVPWKLRRG